MHHLLLALVATATAAALPQQLPLTPSPSLGPDPAYNHENAAEICPLAPKITPDNENSALHPALTFLTEPSIRSKQISRLSRAVQIPTTVTDFMTDPFDPGFDVFVEFQDALKEMFPLVYATCDPPPVHKKAKVEHINRLGLLYTLRGTNPARKPLLFMAHQDVVPVADASDWTHPPFSGHYSADDDFLWGRGASDCKNVLIALLSVLEDLLAQGDAFRPERTILFAFGFDEESHGFLGAGSLAPVLEERFGRDGIEFILDEGGSGLLSLDNKDDDGVIYATPGVGERGALDLVIDLNVTGGHSSIPPAHTGVGIMSEIIYALEHDNLTPLFDPVLGDAHPTRRILECQLRYSPDNIEPWLADVLAMDDHVAAAKSIADSRGPMTQFLLQTSQAADMFNGGVKTNALPEKVVSVVNYRVGLHQRPEDVISRAEAIIARIADEHGLSFSPPPRSHDSVDTSSAASTTASVQNHVSLRPLSLPLDPAPLSPTSLSYPTWARFAGVTRSVFESAFNKIVVVAGDVMTGNTDTRFYWNLSRNIYRWSPAGEGASLDIHTVDERIKMDAHLQGMMLYYDLIRGFDGD